MSDLALRALSGFGFLGIMAIAWLFSSDRKRIAPRTIGAGVTLQLGLAAILLGSPLREVFFRWIEIPIEAMLGYVRAGSEFLFGPLMDLGYSFALGVLPIVIFMGSLFSILYHLGWIQPVVRVLGRALSRMMQISGVEGLAAVANIFVGMVESGLVVRPYVTRMTRSELFTFMTLGMSTIAGTVLFAYVSILGGGDFAGHLVVASIVSAPAALVVAKLMLPETETPETLGSEPEIDPTRAHNLIDAATEGGLTGLRLAANIGALMIAFVALVALVNGLLGVAGGLVGLDDLSLEKIFGLMLAPLAFLMGIPWAEAREVGALIGIKTTINEFVAYQRLADAIAAGALSPRSALISAYALCGFANFGSLAILLGGIEAIAPNRRSEAAELGLRSILAGTLATCMTGSLAGLIL